MRVHKSNHVCLHYHHRRRLISIKCLDPECEDEQRCNPVLFDFKPGSGDESTVSSLHDCEDQVSWADSYSSEVMQPYPTKNSLVAAIVARMGLGK